VIQIQTQLQGRRVISKPDVSVSLTVLHWSYALTSTPERDSPRDQLVVTLFLLTVFGLLLGAGIKNRMLKAGLTGTLFPWSRRTETRWWEVCAILPES